MARVPLRLLPFARVRHQVCLASFASVAPAFQSSRACVYPQQEQFPPPQVEQLEPEVPSVLELPPRWSVL